MDNKDLLKLVDLLTKESAAMQASLHQTIQELNSTIVQLNETIGALLEENRLLKGPKKNSSNSSIPPSKDENRPARTGSLRSSSGKKSGGQNGHQGSTLKMTSTPDHIVDHCPNFCRCCGLTLEISGVELTARRQVIDIPIIKPSYTEHRI